MSKKDLKLSHLDQSMNFGTDDLDTTLFQNFDEKQQILMLTLFWGKFKMSVS